MTKRTCSFCEKKFGAADVSFCAEQCRGAYAVKREELSAAIGAWMKAGRTKMTAQAAEEAARVRVEEARKDWALAKSACPAVTQTQSER